MSVKQKFTEWFTKNNNGCSPAMEDDRGFVHEKTRHMFEAYLAGVAEGEFRCAALASLEAEAAGYMNRFTGRVFTLEEQPGADTDVQVYVPVYTAPPGPVSVPEWTNEQCLEFLSIAFRHAEIKGDIQLDDIRLGVKMVNFSRAAMLQGAENAESRSTIQTAPVLDSLPKIAESRCSNSPVIPDGLRLALSNAGIAAPESDEMLAATCEKYIQALVTWVKERNPFRSAVLPNGWVLVPVDPTPEMREAYDQAQEEYEDVGGLWSPDHQWQAMLAAAPQQELKL